MAGSPQYPHVGEQKEGEDNGRSECADGRSFVCLVVPRIRASGQNQDQEHNVTCVKLHVAESFVLWKDKSSTVHLTSHGS